MKTQVIGQVKRGVHEIRRRHGSAARLQYRCTQLSAMPVVTPALVAVILVAGMFAGGLGATLGIGGGVFLVPFLTVVMGFPISVAAAISLTTVIGTLWLAWR